MKLQIADLKSQIERSDIWNKDRLDRWRNKGEERRARFVWSLCGRLFSQRDKWGSVWADDHFLWRRCNGQSGIDRLPRRCHWDFPTVFWSGSFRFCDRRPSHRILKEAERNLEGR
jgi:hypothetical protein